MEGRCEVLAVLERPGGGFLIVVERDWPLDFIPLQGEALAYADGSRLSIAGCTAHRRAVITVYPESDARPPAIGDKLHLVGP